MKILVYRGRKVNTENFCFPWLPSRVGYLAGSLHFPQRGKCNSEKQLALFDYTVYRVKKPCPLAIFRSRSIPHPRGTPFSYGRQKFSGGSALGENLGGYRKGNRRG